MNLNLNSRSKKSIVVLKSGEKIEVEYHHYEIDTNLLIFNHNEDGMKLIVNIDEVSYIKKEK